MFPTPAIRSWFKRNAFTGCLRPRACSRSASAVKSGLSGSTPTRDAKYSARASLPRSTSPVPKRRMSTNSSFWPSSSCIRTRVCLGSSSLRSRLPVIRRCITRWTSSSNDITRYLPRRPSRSITRPFRASAIASGGAGSHQRGSSTRICLRRRPWRAGASWRRIVSTSGSSGTSPGSSRPVPCVLRSPVSAHGRSRMRPEVDVLQPLAGQVCVELGRRDVGVPEHLLDRAEVAAAGEQVRREGMTQRVRAHAVREAGRHGVAADDLVEALTSQLAAAEVNEQMRLGRALDERGAAALEVHAERPERRLADRDQALLRALAASAQNALLDVHVHQLQADRLGGAQSARVHQLEQRPIAERRRLGAARLRQQLLDLAAREDVRQLPRAPRRAESRGGIRVEQPVAPQVPVERAQAGALAVDGGGRSGRSRGGAPGGRARVAHGTALSQRLEKIGYVTGLRVQRRQIALREEAAELQEVRSIRIERVTGEASLELQICKEVKDEVLEPALDDRLLNGGHG